MYKIGELTFQIGTIDSFLSYNNYFFTLVKLLDRGLKFIPSIFLNEFAMFKFILSNFDENFNVFNSKLKLIIDNFTKEISHELSPLTSTDTDNFNIEPLSGFSFCFDTFSLKLKKTRNNFEKLRFRLSHESIDFKFNFYKYLFDTFKSNKLNIDIIEFKFLNKYINDNKLLLYLL